MIIDLILVIEMIVHGFKMFSKSSFAFFPVKDTDIFYISAWISTILKGSNIMKQLKMGLLYSYKKIVESRIQS
jgi:hypothetical protein